MSYLTAPIPPHDLLEATKTMVTDHLRSYLDSFKVFSNEWEVPDPETGVVFDPTIDAVDEANSLKIWLDQKGTFRYLYNDFRDDYAAMALLATFTWDMSDIGRLKHNIGGAIQQMITERHLQYLGELGVYDMHARIDFRFSSLRQDGGSRRGMVGNRSATGHAREAVVVAAHFKQRVFTPIYK